MNFQRIIVVSGALPVFVSLSGCLQRRLDNETGNAPQVASTSAVEENYTSCELSNSPEGKFGKFRGRDIQYYSSDEIPYQDTSKWWQESNSWISKDILDASILGYPGQASSSREAVSSSSVNVRFTGIDVRKVGGKFVYHYFSNNTANNPIENWSSTKLPTIVMAGHTVRLRSQGTVGMYSKVSDREDFSTHLNTVVETSDNGTANWFRSIVTNSGRQNFMNNWLDSTASFRGNYTSKISALGKNFAHPKTGKSVAISSAGDFEPGGVNTVRPIVMAEFWKRIALNEADPKTWLKNLDYSKSMSSAQRARLFTSEKNFSLQKEDLNVLWYGDNEEGSRTGFNSRGAPSSTISGFGGQARLDSWTGGKWRLSAKLGVGFSDSRSRYEGALGGFLCLPRGSSLAGNGQGRLLVWFVNAQTTGNIEFEAVDTVVKNWFSAMVPEAYGTQSLWAKSTGNGGTTPQAAVLTNTLTAKVGTILRKDPPDSGAPAASQKCGVKAQAKVVVTEGVDLSAGGSVRRTLAEDACTTGFGRKGDSVSIFLPHF